QTSVVGPRVVGTAGRASGRPTTAPQARRPPSEGAHWKAADTGARGPPTGPLHRSRAWGYACNANPHSHTPPARLVPLPFRPERPLSARRPRNAIVVRNDPPSVGALR